VMRIFSGAVESINIFIIRNFKVPLRIKYK
jgi:hypothetical protein